MDNAILVFPGNARNEKGGNFPRGEINSTSECVPRIRFPFEQNSPQDLSSASVFRETKSTRDRERERTRGREKKKKEKKRSKDYSTPFLQPLNDAKKDAVQDSCGDRRPGPIWPVSIEIRTCASRPRRRL